MAKELTVISPINSQPYATRPLLTAHQLEEIVETSHAAFQAWGRTPLSERVNILTKFADIFGSNEKKDIIIESIVKQMGRPIRFGPGEIKGTLERARYMISIAEESLKDVYIEKTGEFQRFMRRVPLGPIYIVAAWNYPYLTMVNGVVPALLAGNTVILKHSPQTPLCGEIFEQCLLEAGLPKGVFQSVIITDEQSESLVKHPRISFAHFTGSVEVGKKVQLAAASSGKIMGTGMELGGKDPAYVLADCDLDYTVEQLVDGAFFNSGQCCCAIERIYVAQEIWEPFLEKFVEGVKAYKLGDPMDPETNLGPMSSNRFADLVRSQLKLAIEQGAKPLIPEELFPKAVAGTPYVSPQVLINVNHNMKVMTDESFGPIIGLIPVASDAEAINFMNDSTYGLTASIWTKDQNRALAIGDQVQCGTWYMNRCDYLDPALPWCGVKNSGLGCTLSKWGFDVLTKQKSFHLKLKTH